MDEENHIPKQSPDWADSQRWETNRGTIQELYHSRNLPLKEVMKIMEQEHKFRATPRMYKMRFRAWGLDKNFKEAEVVELYRLRRERIGKPTIYTIRGREVDWDKVQTYVRRKGLNIPHLVENAPPSPAAVKDVAARTPSPELDSSDSSMSQLPKPEAPLPPVNTIRQPMPPVNSVREAPVNTIRQPIALPPVNGIQQPRAPLRPPPSSSYRAQGSHSPEERAREYRRFLRLVYDMILDEDEDKRWGTTEYWRRNDRSQGWMMTVRYKLAMHRNFLRIQALKGDSAGVRAVRRFRTLNRSFALLEPVSRSIIGSRMFYMLNFVCAFGSGSPFKSGNPFTDTARKMVNDLPAQWLAGVCIDDAQPDFNGQREQQQLNSPNARLPQFLADNAANMDKYEATERLLVEVLDRMCARLRLSLPAETILMLTERNDGYPLRNTENRGAAPSRRPLMSSPPRNAGDAKLQKPSSSSSHKADAIGTAAATIDSAVGMLIRGEDAKAENLLLSLSGEPGGSKVPAAMDGASPSPSYPSLASPSTTTAAGISSTRTSPHSPSPSSWSPSSSKHPELAALTRCAHYRLSMIIRHRKDQPDSVARATEHLRRSVANSLLFDSDISWDEASFLFE